MRETVLKKGLLTFNYEQALQTLYDFVTKSRPNQDRPDYEFIHEMMSKVADGEPLEPNQIARVKRAYEERFGA